MELWHAWTCPYCARVRAALAEKGIAWEGREVDLARKPPELFQLNPKGGVPVLVDGDRVVPESLDILEYLESLRPEPSLFPAATGREGVRRAYDRVNALLGPHVVKLARGTPEEKAAASVALRAAFATLEAEVSDAGFLLASFSVADLALASFVGKVPPDLRPSALGLPRLSRWEAAVMERPSVKGQLAAPAAG
jgi:glutathione S-transferase